MITSQQTMVLWNYLPRQKQAKTTPNGKTKEPTKIKADTKKTRKHTQWCTTTEHMHIRNRLFFFLFRVCIFCYLVIRGCFHVLELSDLFIKKCYFPVLLLHHLQKSEIVMWWLLINTSQLSPLSQPCGGLLTVHWLRQRRNVLAAAVSFAWQNDVQKKKHLKMCKLKLAT